MRRGIAVLGLGIACSQGAAPSVAPAHRASAPVLAKGVVDAGASAAPVKEIGNGNANGHGPEAVVEGAQAPADAGLQCAPIGESVLNATLLVGDSTVGFHDGLSRGLERRFAPLKGDFFAASYASMGITAFPYDERWIKVIKTRKPRLVVISLGTNNVFYSRPKDLVPHIERIVKKTAPAECVWIAPPVWGKGDTGVVELLREHTAPCRFFDTTRMKIERTTDGIHPSTRGGERWADAVYEFMARCREP